LGDTPETTSKLVRGVRMILRKLGILEVDLWKNELRFSSQSGIPPAQARQLRINDDEIAIEWDQHIMAMDTNGFSVTDALGNFFSFKNGEFFLKASKIGFAGPLAMWDYTEATAFTRDKGYPDPDREALLWDSKAVSALGQPAPGLYFKQDVYFGTAGSPAVLQTLFDEHYKPAMTLLGEHTHTGSAPGAPTGPPQNVKPYVDPNDPTNVVASVLALNVKTLDNPLVTELWFSLMQISL
ncbi:unnamed protein product, partial [marine sediment metagenome]